MTPEEHSSRLHAAIMNITCHDQVMHREQFMAYKLGHRDARHAAAELAQEAIAAATAELREEVEELRAKEYPATFKAMSEALAERDRLRTENERLKEKARLFLMWFERDGEPVDGFRFREQWKQLNEAVEYESWIAKLLPPTNQPEVSDVKCRRGTQTCDPGQRQD